MSTSVAMTIGSVRSVKDLGVEFVADFVAALAASARWTWRDAGGGL